MILYLLRLFVLQTSNVILQILRDCWLLWCFERGHALRHWTRTSACETHFQQN